MQNRFNRIGFIGPGKMAEVMIQSISQLPSVEGIYGLEKSASRQQEIASRYQVLFPGEQDFFANVDLIILAIKPQQLEQTIDGLRTAWKEVDGRSIPLLSILAGVSSRIISALLPVDMRVVRLMPNTPALIGEGISAICFPSEIAKTDQEEILKIVSGLGKTLIIEEGLMHAVTAVSGSGPAYVYSFIQGMVDAGVYCGLSRDMANTLVLETILGATRLVQQTGSLPYSLRSDVTSPGGTTIHGLKVMQENGFEGILINAIESAFMRSQQLEEAFEDRLLS